MSSGLLYWLSLGPLASGRPTCCAPAAPCFVLQASSAYTAGPHHALFSLSLSSIYKQDVLSGSTDFLRVDGIPVSTWACLQAGRKAPLLACSDAVHELSAARKASTCDQLPCLCVHGPGKVLTAACLLHRLAALAAPHRACSLPTS